eukprot:g22648.t1
MPRKINSEVIGRDRYGVFPLRGKILNVRDATFAQTMSNAEIANITKIIGLEPKKEYHSANSLRYGSIMVMTDQDYDGSHIKGLILNFIQHWWPSLFRLPGFMTEFVTPIVGGKAIEGFVSFTFASSQVKATRRGSTQQFFTMQEYEQWKAQNHNGRGWHLKYYKGPARCFVSCVSLAKACFACSGLGTSTTAEAKEYFSNINEHSLSFQYNGQQDDESFDMAFNKKRADDRKDLQCARRITELVQEQTLDSVGYTDFINKELVQFAKYDVLRAIPSLVDGFKPVQRKIMWAAFKRNLNHDTKVAQFAGLPALARISAIVGLAQNFVGSNNVNLLFPAGQFGTRIQGGKDAASARYIYTRLERISRLIFHPADDALLDVQRIEPKWYIPVIPTVLINGAEGIGTGWSTFLPNYHPRDIIANLKRYIRCEPVQEMCPWYAGFKGSLVLSPEKLGYESWAKDYKVAVLQAMLSTEGPGSGQIEDFKDLPRMREKLVEAHASLSTNNMMFFDKDGKIKKYADERQIIEEFAELRLEYYHKRKAHLVRVLQIQAEVLAAKARFVQEVIDEKLKVKNRKKDSLIEDKVFPSRMSELPRLFLFPEDLRKHGFKTLQEITEGEHVEGAQGRGWEYLLGMPLWSLTAERVATLLAQLKEKQDRACTNGCRASYTSD